ncbi:MAG TPA: PA domain-containing protein [Pyrinomonadaceae bacterium]|nr:PA domain-containing protein [Pyrinomonadaceae bacterium]
MRNSILARLSLVLLTSLVVLSFSASAFGAATIVIQNNDGAGVGFNDPTAVAPTGGNPGTTLGQQRLNAFQFAANIWGATLVSNSTITVGARWTALPCTANSAVLGSAGAATIFSDFPGAPFSSTWYSAALANALRGSDLDPGVEINAQFNVNLGTTGCGETFPFYLGLDNNHGNGTDLVAVLLHEFSHGLGFQTFTNASTGVQPSGIPSIFDRFLFDNTTGKIWAQMNDSERQASALNTGHLTWSGSTVKSQTSSVLATPRLRINSPPGIAGNYVVGTASFGPPLSSAGITASVVQALDPSDGAGALTTDGCSALTNGGAVSGKIALFDRGNCNFTVKTKNAQNAGAVGVVIADNVAGSPPPALGGTDATITIPSVRITLADGNTLKSQLGSGVNATLVLDHSVPGGADSSGRALLYAPNPFEAGSSVSHWDTTAFPNQLMEPDINGDLSHSVNTPQDLTASLMKDIGWVITTSTPANTAQFSSASQGVNETLDQTTKLDLTVLRSGDTSGAATIDYASANGTASERSDYLAALGTLHFAPGETSKTIPVFIVDDRFGEGPETFTVNLSSPVGCTLGSQVTFTITINSNEAVNGTNPVKDATFNTDFFVRQHYLDFFTREPDAGGLAFWKDQIDSCTTQECREIRRINVSAAFFKSIEFQETGYLVERLYKVAYGDAVGTSSLGGTHQLSVPVVRLNEFLADTQQIGRGVVIGNPGAELLLESNKQALIAEFVQRSRFTSLYPASMSAGAFVNELSVKAGPGVVSNAEFNQLVADLSSGAKTRAEVLRAIAEDSNLFAAESNRAFVLAQFFGYLRRNPNDSPDSDYTGYDFWLGKLNQFNGNFVNAEMVKAFIVSSEYQLRFGP